MPFLRAVLCALTNVNKCVCTGTTAPFMLFSHLGLHALGLPSDSLLSLRQVAVHKLRRTRCAHVWGGVDAHTLHEPTPRQERKIPILYIRAYDGIHINRTELFAALKLAGIFTYTMLQTTRVDGDPHKEHFDQEENHAALRNAPYMIAYTPGMRGMAV